MGSKSSKSSESNEDYYGQWKESKCSCANGGNIWFNDDIVEDIYWRSTYLVNNHVKRLSTFGRVMSFGLSEIWCKGMSLTHDYIEAYIKCSKCGSHKWVTFEYGKGGKNWRIGYYKKSYSENGSVTNIYKNFKYVLDKYSALSGFEAKDYKFTKNNCKDFARKLYYELCADQIKIVFPFLHLA